MSINLNPTELQALIDQILAALAPSFEKRVEVQRKAVTEAIQCLTVEEVAKRLKCVPKTVCKWIAEGKLRAANLGTFSKPVWRVSETDFADFYRQHRK